MNTAFESVAVKLVTEEGLPLAVGGICRSGSGAYWRERFLALRTLRVAGGDIYTIDHTLASAIQAIADDSLLIAGGTLDAMAESGPGGKHRRRIGCPREAIGSAPDAPEKIAGGIFSLYVGGGPGLAALADQATTRRAAMAIKALGQSVSGSTIQHCMHAAGINTYLLFLTAAVRKPVAAWPRVAPENRRPSF